MTFELMLLNGDLFAVVEGDELERKLEPLLGWWGASEDAAVLAVMMSRGLRGEVLH
jgi:hypothetical protein